MWSRWFKRQPVDAAPGSRRGQHAGKDVSTKDDLPVEIDLEGQEPASTASGGLGIDIARLQHELDAHEKRSAMNRQVLRDELDGGWARDQQRTSILLFRAFGVSLLLLFHFALYVMLTTDNHEHEHLASVVMEMILASVIAGFLGYMLAKPFEHRR